MAEKDRDFAPTDPSVEEDLMAPESEGETKEEASTPEAPSRRPFTRIGWTLVAVVAVLGALMVVELGRMSNALNKTACIQRAQSNFMEALGPGVTAQFAGLDRLTGLNELNKCGR